MILIDSSAWIEFLRRTGSPEHRAVRRVLASGEAAVCDAVALELLCWPGSEQQADNLESLIGFCHPLDQVPMADASAAGALYRACSRQGETVRRPMDCLIAAIAIRHDVPLLHRDRAFDVLTRHTPLRVVAA